jgi:catechol 2,3-dioxygenase-like lactoylglutathione lyase family enzyme
MPGLTGVSHVELTVSDVERSAAWYGEVLGFDTVLVATDTPDFFQGRVISVLRPDIGLGIGLVEHQDGDRNRFSEFRVGLDHLAFAVGSRSDLEAWVEHFDRLGVVYSPINDMPYACVVVFRDPDGIQLELFALPR